MTKLGQFGRACGDFVQGAARACNGALQMVDEHPWGTTSHASSVAFLPRFVSNLFEDDRVAHTHNLMDHTPMQALAVGSQLALFGRFAASADLVAPALLPAGSAFAALLRTAPLIVVLSITLTPLPIPLPLHPADSSRIWP